MKMSDVRVGMRLRSRNPTDIHPIVLVTEIIGKGFKYSIDKEIECFPRMGLYFAKEGHEHYGINGEAFYEPIGEQMDIPKYKMTAEQFCYWLRGYVELNSPGSDLNPLQWAKIKAHLEMVFAGPLPQTRPQTANPGCLENGPKLDLYC